MYEVICSDGQRRHPEPFPTVSAAENWAWWGHVCTATHEVRPITHEEDAS